MGTAGNVLVVDDYEPSLKGLRALLEAAGYVVTTETNGRDALGAAQRDQPDLVLLDVVMPGMSGVEVCKELKHAAATRFTPVVLISGSQDRKTHLAGLESGADDFLSKPVDPDELRARVRSLIRVKRLTNALESAEALLLTLGKIVEARDPYTKGHCERLANYATALGVKLQLEQDDLDALYRGAFLHDIGKIAIPDRILLKTARLDREEYELMKQHPLIGDSLCGTLRSLERVRPIVRHHHERCDGRGYPDGLAGDDIPLLAQIVSVVDVFDALTTDRPYREALSMSAAYDMLIADAEGGWCRRDLVATFIDLHRAEATWHVALEAPPDIPRAALTASPAPRSPGRRPAAKRNVVTNPVSTPPRTLSPGRRPVRP